jgi:hypothetical protein
MGSSFGDFGKVLTADQNHLDDFGTGPRAFRAGLGGLGKGLQTYNSRIANPTGGAPQIGIPAAPQVSPDYFAPTGKKKNSYFGGDV